MLFKALTVRKILRASLWTTRTKFSLLYCIVKILKTSYIKIIHSKNKELTLKDKISCLNFSLIYCYFILHVPVLYLFTIWGILLSFSRQFLWSFRLPGEAQKIDRMMECFAERYCELNPGVFTSTGILSMLFCLRNIENFKAYFVSAKAATWKRSLDSLFQLETLVFTLRFYHSYNKVSEFADSWQWHFISKCNKLMSSLLHKICLMF